MWGRKDETSEQPAGTLNKPAGTARTAPPASASPPAPRSAPPAQARIGKALKVKGEITGGEDLVIDGEVEGTVNLSGNSLTVGPNGSVRAHVNARTIAVFGKLHGNVHAVEKIEISDSGMLEGDIVSARIIIEDGAIFRGSIDITKPGQERGPEKKSAAAAAAKSAAAERARAGGAAARSGERPAGGA